nr:elongator complex protein 1 [Quercus suber]
MRNLRNIRHRAISFGDSAQPLTATAFDLDELVCAFGPSEANQSITLKRFPPDAVNPEDGETITSWDAISPHPDLAVDRILDLHCFADARTLVLVLEGGDIVVVRQDALPNEGLIEIVGSVDAGIEAAAWSPDDELLAICTKGDTLLCMTRDFEGITSVTLSSEDLAVSDHVSVGWGKRETQFKGRGAAKVLRDPTMPEHFDQGVVSSFDDGSSTISWRGDGQFVALNRIVETDIKRRVIRVFSREGALESVSEPVDGLEAALSWKPSGQVLAGIQRTDERIDVVFFERNGLRHGEFDLRFSKEECANIGARIELKWNVESTVLAVALADRIQLWTMGNYHYYLKQEIRMSSSKGTHVSWHQEKSLQLICSSSDQIRRLNYTLAVARGSTLPPHDLGLVAVIDGRTLKVTPLRTANVPPPMAFNEIILPAPAVDVAFNPMGTQMAVLHHDRITIWTFDYAAKPTKRASLRGSSLVFTEIDKSYLKSAFWQQIAWLPNKGVSCVALVDQKGTSKLLSFTNGLMNFSEPRTMPMALCTGPDRERVFCEDDRGSIHDLQSESSTAAMLTSMSSLPAACPSVEIWHGTDGVTIAFGLADSGILHVVSDLQQKMRIPGCTSFLVTTTHLIYTTSQHLLKFVHLHAGELETPADEPEKDERCRSVERGAKLVTVMPSAFTLVLQMPRGNLESIYPRALVLAGIRTHINNRDYKKAFLICRTHRVDMNILHDYAPGQFMQDVDLFLKQVKKAEYIDLFLSSLTEDDTSKTLYKETMNSKSQTSGNVNGNTEVPRLGTASKVNDICDLFLRSLDRSQMGLQNVITAHVCKSPPDLEAGLTLVSRLAKEHKQEELEQAVDHICFLADINQLYETALGLYDLDVALLVAQQSQKDPREYLPYLQALHEKEPLRQRFQIDDDLKRYTKALTHLHTMEAFGELKDYVSKHELYTIAAEFYRYDTARLRELMRLHADYLGSRNRYKDAALAYEFVGDQKAAYEAYRSAGMWRECLAAANLLPVDDTTLVELAKDLADVQEEAKNFTDAATIHVEYLSDLQAAIKLLCKGYHFAEAIRLVAKHHEPHLLSSLVDTGLVEGSANMTELLSEMKSQLQAQIPRLRDLRQKKADDPMAFLDGAEGDEGDVPDNISLAPTDASTTGTFMTRYTNNSTGTLATNATRKTSKNRRREERKRARGKKGTVYEEEYLVNSIARLIERLNTVSEDVTSLVEGLMRRGMRERAVAVEAAMRDVEEACQSCIAEVFGSSSTSRATNGDDANVGDSSGAARPVGGQGVLWDALALSGQTKEAPLLKHFEKLSLLS